MKPSRRTMKVGLVLIVAMFVLTNASGILTRLQAQEPPSDLLAGLPVAAETGAGYDRALFGDGWAPDDGCDTRTRVLVDESIIPATLQGCTVTGEWISIYDGARTTNPSTLDVDHLVPLAEAWASGASGWSDGRRRDYANDLDRPDALIAVTAESNRGKGDRDPAEWMPPVQASWCRYATAWIAQKAAWDLTIDPAERDALTAALATCPQGG